MPASRKATRKKKTTRKPAAEKQKLGATKAAAWTLQRAMTALERAGTAQNRKIYARHGVSGDAFGVSYAALAKLEKAIKTDHALAMQLWATGKHDARVLATMIADPAKLRAADLDRMAKDVDNPVLTGAFANLAGDSPHAPSRIAAWVKAKPAPASELIIAAGYSTASANLTKRRKAKPDPATDLPDSLLSDLLDRIEKTIHDMPNRARESMNICLISIGAYRESLRNRALGVAKSIGKVDVDHGQTGCKTPDAAAYIAKTVERNSRVPR